MPNHSKDSTGRSSGNLERWWDSYNHTVSNPCHLILYFILPMCCRWISLIWNPGINRNFYLKCPSYGPETRKYLEIFEIWCWRRMENIKLSEKVTNEQVLERIGEKRTVLNISYIEKLIGSVIFWDEITSCKLQLKDIYAIEGQITEVKGVGRKRTSSW